MSEPEKETPQVDQLILDRAAVLVNELKKLLPYMDELDDLTGGMKQDASRRINEFALSLKMSKLDTAFLEAFFKKPYPRLRQVKGRPDSWELALPRFMDVQIGYLESQDDSYNYFLVNRYMDWLGEIPEALKAQLGWKPPPELLLEGEELVGSKEAIADAKVKLKGMVSQEENGRLRVNPKYAFEVLASLIRDGIKPFAKKPVDPDDLVQGRTLDFELRDYQKRGWKTFLEHRSAGFFWPPSVGKTFIGMFASANLKPPHLIVVPTVLLKEQWEDRIDAHTDLKLEEEVFVMTYQTAIKRSASVLAKLGAKEWTLKVVDEVQHWPSDWFSKMAFIPSKYTMGLSATPMREDGREEYIFALTGIPVGIEWNEFKRMGIIASPTCHVWVVKGANEKLRQMVALTQTGKKTVVFCDYIEPGKMLAARFKVPFVYGATKDNLETIKAALLEKGLVVVSRVGDEGLSLPEIERVIEYTWNYGSRRQSMQRFGRLLHSQEREIEHNIIMTLEEYTHDRKRLYSIMEKGFKIVMHREGVSEKVIQTAERAARPARASRPARAPEPRTASTQVTVPGIPAALAQRLPGITKTIERLDGREKTVACFLLNNNQQPYSPSEISLGTGLSVSGYGHWHLTKLIELGIAKKEGKKYRSAL